MCEYRQRICRQHTAAMPICGGFTPEEPVTPEEEKICREVKSDIEEKAGTNFDVYIPLSFASQIAEGTNYLAKVYVGVDKCVHVMIFQALPCNGGELTVTGVQHPKTASEPLIPFDD
ncbi:cystatin-B-like isoform X1 [Ctenopharyngodon idella]|uniref:cystatin-B-like isoform X1 n=1 Tax=Ctenopharyngodon idella TaxID=7959 RepID=UPI002232A7C3|nr:cystatin-B-like isoform X1 [Ctenopharyngodon idella]